MRLENCTPPPGRLNYVPGVIVVTGEPKELDTFEQATERDRVFQRILKGTTLKRENFPASPPIYFYTNKDKGWQPFQPSSQSSQATAYEEASGSAQGQTGPANAESAQPQAQDANVPTAQILQSAANNNPPFEAEARRYELDPALEALSVVVALRQVVEKEEYRFGTLDLSVDSIFKTKQDFFGNSPTLREPARALPGNQFGRDAFADQECFERIHFKEFGRRIKENPKLQQPLGKGVTVVIIDSSPAKEQVSPDLVNFWIDLSAPDKFPPPLPDELDPRGVVIPKLKSLPTHRRLVPNRTAHFSRGVPLANSMALERYHGLMIASLIRFLAPEATIVLIKVMNDAGEGDGFAIANALKVVETYRREKVYVNKRRVIEDKLVINLSLGARASLSEEVEVPYMLTICDRLCREGAIFTVAAGNDSWRDHPLNPEEPAAYGYFADTEATNIGIICVAATDASQATRYAWFSNQSDIGAPGFDLVLDLGIALTADGVSQPFSLIEWSGSSFAAPLVAGSAAVLLSARVPASQIKGRLWSTATPPYDWNCLPELNLANAFAEISFLESEESAT